MRSGSVGTGLRCRGNSGARGGHGRDGVWGRPAVEEEGKEDRVGWWGPPLTWGACITVATVSKFHSSYPSNQTKN